jgi:hypothetical protein
LQDDVRGLPALHRPSDDAPRIEVDDHREIGKALLRPDATWPSARLSANWLMESCRINGHHSRSQACGRRCSPDTPP